MIQVDISRTWRSLGHISWTLDFGEKQKKLKRVGFAESRDTGTDSRSNEETHKFCQKGGHTIEDSGRERS